MLSYTSPPLSEATEAEVRRLFQDDPAHRKAYALTHYHICKRWPDGFDQDEYIANHVEASRARAALPVLYGTDPEGNPAVVVFVAPHLRDLPRDHLPYCFISPETVPLSKAAGVLDLPWFIRGSDGRYRAATTVKMPGGTHRTLSVPKIIAELHLGRAIDPDREPVYALGHPGDMRLAALTLDYPKPGQPVRTLAGTDVLPDRSPQDDPAK